MACAKPKGIKDSSFEIYSDQLSVLLGYLLGEEGEYDVILFLGSLEPGGANSHIIIN